MGTLYVAATPIGNLEDITLRAKRILLETVVIACEDTRHTGNLLKMLGNILPKRYISIRDFNEAAVVDKILLELQSSDVALVSDAGTPTISDPGFKLIRAARERGFTVSPIPGATAAIAALSAAGLPTNKFMFWGFLPKKWELMPEMTHIIYESPIRAKQTLEKIQERYPSAQIVLAQELTKIHEYIGTELKTSKGEVVILVYLPALTQ
jgi:16S rRNA (cytidine1402-2'-O)-methyltransferase